MNILVFAHDATMYGASQSLLTALEGIVKRKNRNVLVLLPYKGMMEDALKKSGIDYKVIPFPRCVAEKNSPGSIIKRLKQIYFYHKNLSANLKILKKVALQFKADVIYTNTSAVAVGYKIAKHLNIPHVWHIREFGDKDYNLIYLLGKGKITNCMSKSEANIFVSESLKNHWNVKNGSKNIVVYNGIFDAAEKIISSPKVLTSNKVRIGILGAIFPGKGQDIAIKSFAKLQEKISNSCLLIYGDIMNSEYNNYLTALIHQLNIEDKVYFKGFVNDKDLIFQNIDLLLSCSKMEGFGRSIIEAMSQRIPVIANASGGVLEIIDDNFDGLLYDGSVESLSTAMIKLLSDKKLYEYLSENGLRKAQKYSVEDYVNSIDSILHDASLETHERKNTNK